MAEARSDNRLFVALDLPEDLREHLGGLAEDLAADLSGRAVPAENLHATLSFLGQTEPSRLPEIEAELRASAPASVIEARLDGLRSRSRVIAAQVEIESAEDAVGLDRLRDAVEGIAGLPGSSEEERPMWLHITLVRFRRPTKAASLPDMQWEQVFAFNRVTLYDSHVRPSAPPRYEPVTAVDLTTTA